MLPRQTIPGERPEWYTVCKLRWKLMKSQFVANNPSEADPRYREQVAALAYRLYIENGAREGCEVDDWLQAERLVAATQEVAEGDGRGHANMSSPSNPSPGGKQGESPHARDERGSPSREEVRQKASPFRSAPRQSKRPPERSSQPRSHT